MSDCLNDLQVEDALKGELPAERHAHLVACADCRRRLAEADAIRGRLNEAFRGVHVSADAVERVRAATIRAGTKGPAPLPKTDPETGPAPFSVWPVRHWRGLAAAASVLIALSAAVAMYLAQPTPAEAAAMELVKIHQQNVAGGERLMHESHDASEAYLAGELGFKVAVPDELGDERLKGCCVSRFLGRRAGNMVLDGPNGPISIVVSDATARTLMTRRNIVRGGRTYWVCPMQGFYTVAVRQGRLIYAAVGDNTPENLVKLLGEILDRHSDSQ